MPWADGDALTPNNLNASSGNMSGMFFNVKDPDYGAKGDGTTDDTAAIKAAISAATQSATAVGWTDIVSGAVVYLPPGDYQVKQDIDIPMGVQLIGAGQWNTRINWANTSDASDAAVTSNLAGADHSSKLVVSTQLKNVRVNANSVANIGIHIRGWQEGCLMEGVTASSANSACFHFDAVDDAASGFGVTQNTRFDDLRAIPLGGTKGFVLRDVRRCTFNKVTVDSVTESPPNPVTVGMELQENCYLNNFIGGNIEDCTIGLDVNTDPATGADDCDGNNWFGYAFGSSSASPGATTVGSQTGKTIAALVRTGCKYYNFLGLSQRYNYDVLLYDQEKEQVVLGDNNGGGTRTWRGFIHSAGTNTWISDDRHEQDGPVIGGWTNNANAFSADTDTFDVTGTNNVQVDTTSNDVIFSGVSGGIRGQTLKIIKAVTANALTIENQATVPTGAQQFITPYIDDIVIPAGQFGAVDAVYTGTNWRIDGYNPTATSTVLTLADDATPSIAGANIFKTGGTTTITDFDDGVAGKTIKILAEHAVTITHGAGKILLNDSVDFVMAAGDTLTLTQYNNQVWVEDARYGSLMTLITGIPFKWGGGAANFDIRWIAVDPTAKSWTAPTRDATIWEQLSIDTVQDDVDFHLSASSQFPMRVSDETWEAVSVLSSVITGP